MFQSDDKIDKVRIEAAVRLEDGTDLLGCLFVKPLQRVSDLLNDTRQFLPFQLSDGPIVHLHKSKIAKVTQLAQEPGQEDAFDPYDILGVTPAASDEKLKEAYHGLCSAYHPDKLQGLGLPSDFSEIANSRLVRIIDAYRRIKDARQGANGKDRVSPFTPA